MFVCVMKNKRSLLSPTPWKPHDSLWKAGLEFLTGV